VTGHPPARHERPPARTTLPAISWQVAWCAYLATRAGRARQPRASWWMGRRSSTRQVDPGPPGGSGAGQPRSVWIRECAEREGGGWVGWMNQQQHTHTHRTMYASAGCVCVAGGRRGAQAAFRTQGGGRESATWTEQVTGHPPAIPLRLPPSDAARPPSLRGCATWVSTPRVDRCTLASTARAQSADFA